MRWTIPRISLLVLAIIGSVALAAKGTRGRKDKDPEPVVVEAPPPAPAPAPEPPPALWDQPLPVALQQTPEGLASLSAQSCNGCHYAAHDQWKGGAHARAWSNPEYQEALHRAGDSTACVSCHLPLANQHPRLAVGYLDGDLSRPQLHLNEAWDPTLMSEGVTCAACHVREGKIIGTHAVEGGPHEVVASPELSTAESCATCHQLTWPGADQPFYDTYGEWKASAYADAGVRCQDCHMPLEAGALVATRFAAVPSHELAPQHDRALTVLVDLSSPEISRGEPLEVSLRLLNTGAGHSVPTGSPFKTVTIEVALVGADGKELAPAFSHTLGRQVEDAPPWRTLEDNRIPAGGEVSLDTSFTVDQRKKAQQAVLRIRLLRRTGDPEPIVLQEIPLPLI